MSGGIATSSPFLFRNTERHAVLEFTVSITRATEARFGEGCIMSKKGNTVGTRREKDHADSNQLIDVLFIKDPVLRFQYLGMILLSGSLGIVITISVLVLCTVCTPIAVNVVGKRLLITN